MKRLTEIGKKYKTDKATKHGFTEFYDPFFASLQNPNILEIGVARGASLRMYNDYFGGKCTLTGFDNGEFIKNVPNRKNIGIIMGDQSKQEDLAQCIGEYDIIIDDGGHKMQQQQVTLKELFKKVKKGGFYIIEDLHTSFMKEFNPDEDVTTLDVLLQLASNRYIYTLPFITEEEFKEISTQIQSVQIFWNSSSKGRSITSIITKK